MLAWSRSGPVSGGEPRCPQCRGPMHHKGTRRTFTVQGVGLLTTFLCEACDQIVQREEHGLTRAS
jgi:hypothetical protein